MLYQLITNLDTASHLLAGKEMSVKGFNLYLFLLNNPEDAKDLQAVQAEFPAEFEECCLLGLINMEETDGNVPTENSVF